MSESAPAPDREDLAPTRVSDAAARAGLGSLAILGSFLITSAESSR
jgi:hypothetical protein